MANFIDQIGKIVQLPQLPSRIISLVPSGTTELLHSLGLDERVVGITKFCEYPAHWFKTKTRVGGTKQLNQERIAALKPDLALANKEENDRDQVEQLGQTYPIWTSDIATLNDAIEMILAVGTMTGRETKARAIIDTIVNRFDDLATNTLGTAIYLIWQEPYMTVGGDTFIHDLVERCGFRNCFAKEKRYPVITPEQIITAQPDYLLLSSEPYPFREKHQNELQERFPYSKVVLVDGTYFSWYGSRLMDAPAYLSIQADLTGNK